MAGVKHVKAAKTKKPDKSAAKPAASKPKTTRAKRKSTRSLESAVTQDPTVGSAVSANDNSKAPPEENTRASKVESKSAAAKKTSKPVKKPDIETKPRATIKATKATKATPAAKPKASTTKVAAKNNTEAKPKAKTARMPAQKRKADDDANDTTAATAARPTVAKRAKIAPTPKIPKKGPIINKAPTQLLQCFVFGEGSGGELGLGTRNRDKDVTRPRLNPNLSPETLGIVQIATGGMHTLALTRDNRIVTWGVNDQGALGRNTDWSGGLRDVDAEDSESDEDSPDADSGMNPLETTPTAIASDVFPAGTIFTHVAAGDSCSFALTDDGRVWGWGTFRSDDGVLGFTPTIHTQYTPMLMPTLHNIVKLSCGQNHAVALDSKGSVFAWGSGQQAQIGRKILERHRLAGLTPGEFGLPKKQIRDISTGQNHAFAIDNKDRVWAWGLNSFGQTGIPEGAGEDAAFVSTPTQVKVLSGRSIKKVVGGGLHSMVIDAEDNCLTWGRIDNNQLGVPVSDAAREDIILSPETGKPRILIRPTKVNAIPDPVTHVAAGVDTCLVITDKGKAYSWGFSANYQTGTGTLDDVETPTLIDNTAVREKKLIGAHMGGQFGILTAEVPS